MSVDEFDLLVRAIQREQVTNPKCISIQSESTFYNGSSGVSIFITSLNKVWCTIHGDEFECKKPIGWFSKKDKNKYDAAMIVLYEIRGDRKPSSIEDLICQHVPSAKDIIAEKALVDDHK